MATEMRIPLWQDEAVRNLAQDQLSPLFIAATASTRLDDIAENSVAMSPDQIARFGHAIAHAIDPSLPSIDGVDHAMQSLVDQVAQALQQAERPLLVSGTGAQSQAVIDATAAVAGALKQQHKMLSYCLAEANSLGVTLLSDTAGVSLAQLCARAESGDLQTLIVLENDLYRRASKTQIDQLIAKVENLVVLDALETPTLSQANLILPAATFLETEGTLLSSEGRAQRHYPVFQPAEQRQAAWSWLLQLGKKLGVGALGSLEHFDQVLALTATMSPHLTNITAASPGAEFRDRSMKIPRQSQRSSGRTAMRANISVHEPKQPEDQDTPFSFSMEGANSGKSGALIPFVWAPGWNSNQSIQKFQVEAGGPLKGGTPGVRLFEPIAGSSITTPEIHLSEPETAVAQLQLLPQYRIFGSDELTARSPAIAELVPQPFVQLNSHDAAQSGLEHGDLATANIDGQDIELKVELSNEIPAGCAGISVGLPNSVWLEPNAHATFDKVHPSLVVEHGGSHD